jgi:hypothetical protein
MALLGALACGKKADVPDSAGETATPTIQAAPDDIVPERAAVSDTTPGVLAMPAPSAGKTSAASARPGGVIIGYDSAFGPSYELDSAGRPVPIKKRKP